MISRRVRAVGSAVASVLLPEIIPGTFEPAVDPASTWVDVVQAQRPKDLAAGTSDRAAVFPGALGAQAVAPRTRCSDATQWYDTSRCLTVVTGADDVSPALSTADPSLAGARARVGELAANGAPFTCADRIAAATNGVLGEVIGRG
ncbi:hypothetical protein ACWC2T_42340 [Streptomyces sp. NPDC001393]